ncbi:MAG: ComEA family DNA-binding protein [Candidatus Methylomirabilia bacterium]
MGYRRRELWLLLLLGLAFGIGLAIRELRITFPEVADRLEHFDASEPQLNKEPAPPRRPSKLSSVTVRRDGRLDLNRAPEEELQRLPGIGPILARRIVEGRQRHGPFPTPEDLRRVPGIGAKKLEAIRDLVTVGN